MGMIFQSCSILKQPAAVNFNIQLVLTLKLTLKQCLEQPQPQKVELLSDYFPNTTKHDEIFSISISQQQLIFSKMKTMLARLLREPVCHVLICTTSLSLSLSLNPDITCNSHCLNDGLFSFTNHAFNFYVLRRISSF